jgi:DNA invertase Pin-like site-specific DNA recombinase
MLMVKSLKPSLISEGNSSCDKAGFWPLVDGGVSGSSFEARPGLQAASAKSNCGAYDVFVCFTFDRLSCDLEHSARILKILQFHNVEFWTGPGGRRCVIDRARAALHRH